MNALPRLLVACGLACGVAQAATVYKWVDANGQTHYGQVPPAAGGYDVIQGGAASATPSTPAAPAAAAGSSGAVSPEDQRARERAFIQKAEAERKAKAEAKEKARVAKENCAKARTQLSDLERRSDAPLATVGADGQIKPLTRDEVQGRLDQARQAVAKACAEGG